MKLLAISILALIGFTAGILMICYTPAVFVISLIVIGALGAFSLS